MSEAGGKRILYKIRHRINELEHLVSKLLTQRDYSLLKIRTHMNILKIRPIWVLFNSKYFPIVPQVAMLLACIALFLGSINVGPMAGEKPFALSTITQSVKILLQL